MTQIKSNIPKIRFKEFSGEWEEKKLGDISTFLKGKGITKADIIENGNIECIRYGELYTKYGETIKNIESKTNLEKKGLIFSEKNDVIIPASGETQIDIATASCVLNEGIALGGDLNIIRTKSNGVFLSYYLNSNKKLDIARLSQGISVVHLYSSQLKTLNINLPQLPEQQKIAGFLSIVDERIDNIREKKKNLEAYKNGVMQKIFKQEIRFKDENGKEFNKEWEEKKLKDILFEHKTRNKDNNYNEVFSVAKNKGVINQIEHLGRSYASSDISNYKVIFENDIVYTKSPTSDFPYGIIKQNKTNRSGVVSVLYAIFKPINKNIGLILDYYFSSGIRTYNYLNPLVQKGAKNTMNIGNNDFLNGASISIPTSEEEQQKIVDFLSGIDEKIDSVEDELVSVEKFKKGLLQGMFV